MIQNRKKLAMALAVLFVTNILLVLVMTALPDARAETLRQGSTGEVVRQIQTRLKNWGYYPGAVDGVYGPETTEAVKSFQNSNGLAPDGFCGIRTQQAMGIYLTSENAAGIQRDSDTELLARLITAEADGRQYSVQVAVGAVALNRVRHPSFPGTLSAVIYQPGGFSCVSDTRFGLPVSDTARRAAQDAINGADPSYGAVYYYDVSADVDSWLRSRAESVSIGGVKFCK